MREKNILYIGNFELPDKNAAAHRVLGIAKALRECGNNVSFVGVNKEDADNRKENDIILTKKIVQGFDCFSRPYPKCKREWINYLRDISPYIRVVKNIGKIDVIICYDVSAMLLVKIWRYCRKQGISCVADDTEWYSTKGREFPVNIIKGIDEFFRMRIIQKRMDGLIVISRYLERYYRKCRNVVRIPPTVDLSEDKWNNPYKKDKDILRIVYAGSPGKKDRIDYLVEAVAKISRPYRLDIVGITKKDYLKSNPLHKSIVSRNANIIFHGYIGHQETLEFIKKANYSCFFRDKDRLSMAGFPTKFVEAISCGTPVITNDTSDLKKYIREYNGILIKKVSIDGIQIALEKAPFEQKINRENFDYHNFVNKMSMWAINI